MSDRILKNWLTTALGAIAAGCTVAVPLIVSGGVDRADVLLAFGMAALGAFCKDPAWVRM